MNINLIEENSIFNKLAEIIPVGITIVDSSGEIVFSNSQAEKVLRLSTQKITERKFDDNQWEATDFNGTPLKKEQYPFTIVKKTRQPLYNYRHAIKGPEGDMVFLSINSTPLFNDSGKFDGMINILVDITEMINVERRLTKSENRFRSIFESIPRGMLLYHLDHDDNLIFEDSNPAAKKILGVDTSKFVGMTIEQAFPPLTMTEIPATYRKIAKDGGIATWDQIDYEHVEIKGIYEVLAFQTEQNYVVTSFRDITEKKQAQKRLQESELRYRDAFDRAEFYKDLFAHDINNILQSVKSANELAILFKNSPNYESEIDIFRKTIDDQVNRGANLVDNIRKLSLLEEENKTLNEVDMIPILRNALSTFRGSYSKERLRISSDIHLDHAYVYANDFLIDVFNNILDNALKHNLNETIKIDVKISRTHKNGRSYFLIEFADNGVGVHDKWKDVIFERSHIKKHQGSGLGLGLSLVNKIIQTYNGEIWVQDRIPGAYDKGSIFYIQIPELSQNN